jgi:hypothetical protein
MASAQSARSNGDYIPVKKVIAALRKRLASAQRTRR